MWLGYFVGTFPSLQEVLLHGAMLEIPHINWNKIEIDGGPKDMSYVVGSGSIKCYLLLIYIFTFNVQSHTYNNI